MLNTTLCYISRGSEYLMLHRVKKKNDINHDKWIGIGGKFEADESPDECLLREAREETGLTLTISLRPSSLAHSPEPRLLYRSPSEEKSLLAAFRPEFWKY